MAKLWFIQHESLSPGDALAAMVPAGTMSISYVCKLSKTVLNAPDIECVLLDMTIRLSVSAAEDLDSRAPKP